jgi:hypothetical protein
VSFHHASSLAQYARTAVDLRIRMADYADGLLDHNYLRHMLAGRASTPPSGPGGPPVVDDEVVDAVARATKAAWAHGQTFVVAPAMTAIVAAAAEALDLTGDLLTIDTAPCDSGVLFLPEPIYHRRPTGAVSAIGAITWTTITSIQTAERSWLVCSWAPTRAGNAAARSTTSATGYRWSSTRCPTSCWA